jgi:hypothetical protein
MSKAKFPASVPRKMYWSDHVGGTARCPDCGTALEQERHTYCVGARHRGSTEGFVIGSNAGHFCAKCPVVVLDRNEIRTLAALSLGFGSDVQVVVLGIVDLDAVPKEKAHLPFDQETNPMPLVTFTNFPD